MARTEEGLKNDALRDALHEALGGRSARLEELLARHGTTPSARPNLRLAAAFGVETASLPGPLAPLLSHLAADDSAPNTPRVFLPVAAAHAFVARIREGREVEAGWSALAELAADERGPVRLGTLDALVSFGLREGGADTLVARASSWLELDDREVRYGSAALMVEAIGERTVMAVLAQPEAWLDYLSRVHDEIAQAPRAAERYEGRRRVLLSLPVALATTVVTLRAGERGREWLSCECARAKHPDVREALSLALGKLRGTAQGAVIDALRATLAGSAKPLREAARVRPGTGRGKGSRRTR